MILSDRSIKESVASGRIVITPYEEALVQPASVDVRLDGRFLVFRNYRHSCIDPRAAQPDLTEMVQVGDEEPFLIHPGEFILGSTVERVRLGGDIAAQLGGKSSLGRLGLIVHATAGFIDPGFEGSVTLELSNVANLPIRLYPGMKVGQISFFSLSTPADRPYGHPDLGSKYKGQAVPTASRMHLKFPRQRGSPMTVQDNQVLQRGSDNQARVTLDTGETLTLPVGGPYQVGGAKNVLVGDLWVLAGQSNMEGVGDLVDIEPPHPLVHSFQSREVWDRAEEPLHWLNEFPRPIHHQIWGLPMPETIAPRDPNRTKGSGLGLTFAKTLAEQTGVPIGLIPAAHGGTSMQQWEPSRKGQGGGSLYGATLERVRANGGKVAGILWYQGESDANPADAALYEARMTELAQSFRADFGQPDLPFYYVQLGIFACDPSPDGVDGWNRIRESQRIWQKALPNLGMVSAIDCGLDDGIHIDTPGLKALGRRLAAVASGKPAPNLQSVTYEPAYGWLRVSFDHVQGGLTALGRPNGFSLRDAEGSEQMIIYKTSLNGSDALVKITDPARLPGLSLWYGYGLLPYCNITDATGASVPAFGPVRVGP